MISLFRSLCRAALLLPPFLVPLRGRRRLPLLLHRLLRRRRRPPHARLLPEPFLERAQSLGHHDHPPPGLDPDGGAQLDLGALPPAQPLLPLLRLGGDVGGVLGVAPLGVLALLLVRLPEKRCV